jgi:ribosomal protein L28
MGVFGNNLGQVAEKAVANGPEITRRLWEVAMNEVEFWSGIS